MKKTRAKRWIIAGIGTGVGKTIASAIWTMLHQGAYWKPVETGEGEYDSDLITELLKEESCVVYPSAYRLKAPLSPHHAAELEGIEIEAEKILLPASKLPLTIEMAGGLLAPLREDLLLGDLALQWEASWILVSRHYLGSINHTLLSLEAMAARKIPLHGIIFNGTPYPEGEKVILKHAGVPCLGRILPEKIFDLSTLKRYSKLWKSSLLRHG